MVDTANWMQRMRRPTSSTVATSLHELYYDPYSTENGVPSEGRVDAVTALNMTLRYSPLCTSTELPHGSGDN